MLLDYKIEVRQKQTTSPEVAILSKVDQVDKIVNALYNGFELQRSKIEDTSMRVRSLETQITSAFLSPHASRTSLLTERATLAERSSLPSTAGERGTERTVSSDPSMMPTGHGPQTTAPGPLEQAGSSYKKQSDDI